MYEHRKQQGYNKNRGKSNQFRYRNNGQQAYTRPEYQEQKSIQTKNICNSTTGECGSLWMFKMQQQ